MYIIILDQGLVVRSSDFKVVAPCQSDQDPDFIEYNSWATAGKEITIYTSYDEYLGDGKQALW